MYLLLLAFGAVLSAAGVALAASGVSIRDNAFDVSVVTPGVVAVVGGFLLIGLGLAVRVLQRIELALTVPRAARPGETSEAAAAATQNAAPTKAASRPQPAPFAASSPSAAGESRPADAAPHASLENTKHVEGAELSLSPKAPSRADEDAGEADGASAPVHGNGAAAKAMPRLDMPARSPHVPERSRAPAFDALWPQNPRPARIERAAVAPAAPPSAQGSEPAAAAPAPVTVLKTGAVDGMAYTLYSDGSIEAHLPQGMLRFGSIAELRHHIEQNPSGVAPS